MSIEFYFSSRKRDSIAENDELNKEIVEITINKFEDESKILRKQNILMFFDCMRFSLIQSLGRLIIKDTPPYKPFVNKYAFLEFNIHEFSVYQFIIYLSRKIRESNDKIFKVLTIAHELQHVIQFIKFKDVYLQTGVLRGYLQVEKKCTNELYRNTPTEVDAFRKSKIIAIKIFGKEKINYFIKKEVEDAQNENDKSYWINIKSLDSDKSYNLKNETQKYWDKYENEISHKKDELERKKEHCRLKIAEEYFLEACEFSFK